MQEIITQLKRLKTIAPDAGFLANSKGRILAMEPIRQRHPWAILAWSGAIATVMLSFAISSFVSSPKIVLSSSLNPDNLNNELNQMMNGNIELKDVSYQQVANQTISSALKEISDTNVKHLNASVISKEAGVANQTDTTETSQEVDQLLNEIIQ
jgi:hypothetical protein